MSFENPILIGVGAVCAGGLLWLLLRMDKQNIRRLSAFASERLLGGLISSISRQRRILKHVLLAVSVALLFAAWSAPQWGFRWEEVKRRGVDILFALDVSKSMLARDIKPNRLERAKLAVMDFVSQLKGDRAGLIAFAGTSFLQCPLTLDYDAFNNTLQALDVNVIPRGGTDLSSAIHEAETALSTQSANHKILVLLTDGEDHQARALDVARQTAKNGLKIFTVGVGTPEGELIPVPNPRGGVQFVKDQTGKVVKSRLEADSLEKIAEATGGFYVPLGRRGEGLEQVYREGLGDVSREELSSRMQKVPLNRYQWPLLLAVLILCVEFLLDDRRRNGKKWKLSFPWKKITAVMPVLLCVISNVSASPHQAQDAYKKGNYEQAMQQYETAVKDNHDDAILHFNLGSSAYRAGQFQRASQAFQDALRVTEDLGVQAQSYYNLGNARFRMGEATEKENPQATISQWEQSVQAYESSLKLFPEDENSRFNLEFVKKKLEELKKQQEKQKQNQQNQQNNSNQQDQKDSQDNQNSDSKNQKDQNPQQQNSDSKNQNQPNQNQKKSEQQKQPSSPQNDSSKKDMKPEDISGKNDRQSAPASTRRRPGEMNREEAESLLNALENEQAPPQPAQPAQQAHGGGREEETLKDW